MIFHGRRSNYYNNIHVNSDVNNDHDRRINFRVNNYRARRSTSVLEDDTLRLDIPNYHEPCCSKWTGLRYLTLSLLLMYTLSLGITMVIFFATVPGNPNHAQRYKDEMTLLLTGLVNLFGIGGIIIKYYPVLWSTGFVIIIRMIWVIINDLIVAPRANAKNTMLNIIIYSYILAKACMSFALGYMFKVKIEREAKKKTVRPWRRRSRNGSQLMVRTNGRPPVSASDYTTVVVDLPSNLDESLPGVLGVATNIITNDLAALQSETIELEDLPPSYDEVAPPKYEEVMSWYFKIKTMKRLNFS